MDPIARLDKIYAAGGRVLGLSTKGVAHVIFGIVKAVQFVKARFTERSSWVAIGGGVTAASALSPPWSYVFVAIAVFMVLLPDGQVLGGNPDAG